MFKFSRSSGKAKPQPESGGREEDNGKRGCRKGFVFLWYFIFFLYFSGICELLEHGAFFISFLKNRGEVWIFKGDRRNAQETKDQMDAAQRNEESGGGEVSRKSSSAWWFCLLFVVWVDVIWFLLFFFFGGRLLPFPGVCPV